MHGSEGFWEILSKWYLNKSCLYTTLQNKLWTDSRSEQGVSGESRQTQGKFVALLSAVSSKISGGGKFHRKAGTNLQSGDGCLPSVHVYGHVNHSLVILP